MRIEDKTLVRDQNGDSPGQYGDSCFDTSAFALSHFFVNKEYHPELNLDLFITPTGAIRHQKAIWRQDDESEDQEKPLFMFFKAIQNTKQIHFLAEQNLDLKTGNNRYITLGYEAELKDLQWLRCLVQFVQVLFFWFPCYWDDGAFKNKKWPIGNNWKRSDGYLQWALTANLTPWPFRRLIRKGTLKDKIAAYYKPETDLDIDQSVMNEVLAAHRRLVEIL